MYTSDVVANWYKKLPGKPHQREKTSEKQTIDIVSYRKILLVFP